MRPLRHILDRPILMALAVSDGGISMAPNSYRLRENIVRELGRLIQNIVDWRIPIVRSSQTSGTIIMSSHEDQANRIAILLLCGHSIPR